MSIKKPANVVTKNKQKPKKMFTEIEEDRIIEYYSQNEHLWDPKHPNYEIGVKSLPIQSLVRELASEIHHRFSEMRTTYRANVNKVAASLTTGSDSSNVYVPTWPHYDSMKFLDASQPTRTVTSLTIQTIDESDASMSDEIETGEMEEDYLVEEVECDESIQSKPTPSLLSKASTKYSKNKATPSKGKQVNNEDVVEECLNVLRSVNKENDGATTVATDRCVSYGEFVTASLKDMTPWNQTLAIAEMTNVLIKYDRNNPNVG